MNINVDDLPAMLARYETVLRPDEDRKDWWAGAPSVAFHHRASKFYLAARMRHDLSPRGRRGYEIRILEGEDGVHFKPVKSIGKDEAGLHGFERPALVSLPGDEGLRLYGCGESEAAGGWAIWCMDDVNDPRDIDPATIRTVLPPKEPTLSAGGASEHHATFKVQYKDPFIIHLDGKWHMFVIGFDRVERPYHFTSDDGFTWQEPRPGPILPNVGWHDFFTRPACLLPLDVGYLLVYEGSSIGWFDAGYNIATGLAYSPNLSEFIDLTPTSPLLKSTTPSRYHTWRYSHWIRSRGGSHEGRLLVYFEAACANGTNETRVAILPAGPGE